MDILLGDTITTSASSVGSAGRPETGFTANAVVIVAAAGVYALLLV